MKISLSWLRDYVAIPESLTGRELADALTHAGHEVESVTYTGGDVSGPLVLGRVLSITELTEFRKPIRYCRVDVGSYNDEKDPSDIQPGRGIICGAQNFAVGDLVVISLPGAVLPGGFEIAARKTYGHISDGMICSERELGLGQDHDGILVLPADSGEPGESARQIIGYDDAILDIAVTPDRGDCLSLRGIAREAAVIYGVTWQDPAAVAESEALQEHPGERIPGVLALADNTGVERPGADRFSMATLTGFDPAAQTPQWMRNRIIAAGMRPVSLAVDVTNYVMLELGQPLHAYDADELAGPVQIRYAREDEQVRTLDHTDRKLTADVDLVIADDRGPLALAGVMGGESSEISESTTRIAIESAHFDAETVARACRRHKLSSEASRRFERGVDPELSLPAVLRASELMLRYGGGSFIGTTFEARELEPTRIETPADIADRIAGITYDRDESVRILEALGCVVASHDDQWKVSAPTWRFDLQDPADVAEEIIRLVGYDKIPGTLPRAQGRGLTSAQRAVRRIGTALAAQGWTETLNSPFIGQTELAKLGITEQDPRQELVRLANPLSDELPYYRSTLLPGLVRTLLRNIGRETWGARSAGSHLFEIGYIAYATQAPGEITLPQVDRRPSDAELELLTQTLPTQRHHVAAIGFGAAETAGWWGSAQPVTWSDAIATVQQVAQAVGPEVAQALDVRQHETAPWHPGRCAAFSVNGQDVGFAGELAPRVCEQMGLPERTVALELDLDVLLSFPQQRMLHNLAHYPVNRQDISMIVPETVTAGQVVTVMREAAGDLLESIRLFDVFRSEQIGSERKSVTVSLVFRAADRTLSDADIEPFREAAATAAMEQLGAVRR